MRPCKQAHASLSLGQRKKNSSAESTSAASASTKHVQWQQQCVLVVSLALDRPFSLPFLVVVGFSFVDFAGYLCCVTSCCLSYERSCVSGTYCYNNDQCQREVPEFRGYAGPSIGVLLGVFLVGSTALCCGIAALSIAREYVKESTATRRHNYRRAAALSSSRAVRLRAAEPSGSGGDEDSGGGGGGGGIRYLTLAGDSTDEEDNVLLVGSGGGINANPGNPFAPEEEEGGAAAAGAGTPTATRQVTAAAEAARKGKRDYGPRRVRRSSRRRRAADAAALGPSPLAKKVSFFTRMICGTGMAATLLVCGVVVALAPHTPGVNVCNTEFDWVRVTVPLGRRVGRWERKAGDAAGVGVFKMVIHGRGRMGAEEMRLYDSRPSSTL